MTRNKASRETFLTNLHPAKQDERHIDSHMPTIGANPVNAINNLETCKSKDFIADRVSFVTEHQQHLRTEAPNITPTNVNFASYFAMLRIYPFDRFDGREGNDATPEIAQHLGETLNLWAPFSRIGRVNRGSIEFIYATADVAQATAVLSALCEKLDHVAARLARDKIMRFSIGAVLAKEDAEINYMIDCAERALALADQGHSRFVFWDDAHRTKAAAQISLSSDLRLALARGDLQIVYQPKLNLRTGQIDAAEALVRWTHSEKGVISPNEFIKLAEETGDIKALTRYVLERVLDDQAVLKSKGSSIAMNVNLSGGLIADNAFCEWALAECGRAVADISLEITETAVITDPERALANSHRLVNGGVGIAIDDYGSGLSSLFYLKQLPADELKIDKIFISNLTSSHRDPLIVRSTIDLAHALEMTVTAEGVEDQQSLALLRAMGCDYAQGYYVCRPASIEAFTEFLATSSARDFYTGSRQFRLKAR